MERGRSSSWSYLHERWLDIDSLLVPQLDYTGFNVIKKFIHAVETRGKLEQRLAASSFYTCFTPPVVAQTLSR